jgi:hypothetical protein
VADKLAPVSPELRERAGVAEAERKFERELVVLSAPPVKTQWLKKQ